MNVNGDVYDLSSIREKLGEEAVQKLIDNNDLKEVDWEDLTDEQKAKYGDNDQPVVEPDDSKAGQQLLMMQLMKKYVEKGVILKKRREVIKSKRRAKNKVARKSRKNNRKR